MPIYKLKEEMPFEELQGWQAYFDKRPVGWKDDLRTYYLLGAQGDKRKPGEIFESLAKITSRPKAEAGNTLQALKGSMLFMQMLNAKGGDKLEL